MDAFYATHMRSEGDIKYGRLGLVQAQVNGSFATYLEKRESD